MRNNNSRWYSNCLLTFLVYNSRYTSCLGPIICYCSKKSEHFSCIIRITLAGIRNCSAASCREYALPYLPVSYITVDTNWTLLLKNSVCGLSMQILFLTFQNLCILSSFWIIWRAIFGINSSFPCQWKDQNICGLKGCISN